MFRSMSNTYAPENISIPIKYITMSETKKELLLLQTNDHVNSILLLSVDVYHWSMKTVINFYSSINHAKIKDKTIACLGMPIGNFFVSLLPHYIYQPCDEYDLSNYYSQILRCSTGRYKMTNQIEVLSIARFSQLSARCQDNISCWRGVKIAIKKVNGQTNLLRSVIFCRAVSLLKPSNRER